MSNHYAEYSYSYQGQDLFVLEVLGGIRGGYFLDSGASNGISGSNSRLLELSFGWTGICIEPNDATFRDTTVATTTGVASTRFRDHILRAGINYRF